MIQNPVAALHHAVGVVRDRVVFGARQTARAVFDGVRSITGAQRPSAPAPRLEPPEARPPQRPTEAPARDAAAARPLSPPTISSPGRPPRRPAQVVPPARSRLPLGEVIHLLAAGRAAAEALSPLAALSFLAPRAKVAPQIPAGARWLSRDFACPAGERAYRLYVPASAPLRPRGLVVMLHGCKQDADDFALGTGMNAVAEEEGFLVAYPEQARAANPLGCWNWFRPDDQGRDRGEPAILAGIAHTLSDEFDVDRTRVFVAGLSAGAAMALVLGATHPDLFAAVGSHSGVPYGAASDAVSALAAMRGTSAGHATRDEAAPARSPRTIVFQGSADHTVFPINADRIVASLRPAGVTEQRSEGGSPDGYTYHRTTLVDAEGTPWVDHWLIEGAGHAWSGGDPIGSYADAQGPDASREMMRFFLAGRVGGHA